MRRARAQVEELAAAAVKEEAIEAKLAALAAQWAVLSLTFQDYKTRGPVILKARPCAATPCHSCSAHAPRACKRAPNSMTSKDRAGASVCGMH